jgi:hypothetical protein
MEFKIQINKNYTIECFLINSEKKETKIQLKGNEQDEYIPCISFDEDSYSVCKENEENVICLCIGGGCGERDAFGGNGVRE